MIFVRHPSVAVPQGLCYGRLEVPLADNADAEISACLDALPAVQSVIASPLARCRALARRIADRHGAPLRFDARLMEYHFGVWEGRLWADIPRAQSDPWTEALVDAAPPGGESFAALIARVSAALDGVAPGTVVVTHAGPIRAARMLRTGASFDTVFAQKIPHAVPLFLDRQAA